jgi:hypothetical protein
VLASLDAAAAPVDYLAERDQGKPPAQRGRYRVVEDTMAIDGQRTTDPVVRLRRVFVWSSARAQAAATARARKLDRARDDLQRLTRGLGSRHYPTPDKVQPRLAAIAKQRRISGLLDARVGTDPATGQPTLAWRLDPAALATEQATDGWYALVTNLDPPRPTPPRCWPATRAKRSSNAAPAASKARWRSRRCSCSPTDASRRWSP